MRNLLRKMRDSVSFVRGVIAIFSILEVSWFSWFRWVGPLIIPTMYVFFVGLLTLSIYLASEWILNSSIHPEIKKAIVSPEVYAAFITIGGAYLTYVAQRNFQIQQKVEENKRQYFEKVSAADQHAYKTIQRITEAFYQSYLQSTDLEERKRFSDQIPDWKAEIDWGYTSRLVEKNLFKFFQSLDRRNIHEPSRVYEELLSSLSKVKEVVDLRYFDEYS